MNIEKLKNIFAYSWPFLGLASFILAGWIYVRPHFSDWYDNIRGIEGVKEIFENPDPDTDYVFFETQAGLKPKKADELSLQINFSEPKNLPNGIKVSSEAGLIRTLENAKDDDIIILSPGEYRVNLEIKTSLNLLGSGQDTVLMPKDEDKPAIIVDNEPVAVENLMIKDGRMGIVAQNTALTVARVLFTGQTGTALYSENGKLTADQVWIREANFGLKTVNAEGEIKNSIITKNSASGIELRKSKFNIINNQISSNGSYGVYADPETEVYLEGNYIGENSGFEVRVEGRKRIYK
jgi:hypothetical protein